jgi:hypothetical protein
MAATDRLHGKNGAIKMDPTGVGGVTAVLVASLNKWDLDLATDKVRVTAFQDPNHVYVAGLPDIKGTYGGLYDPADGLVIFDVIGGSIAPYLEMIPDLGDALHMFAGKGLMDGKITVDANGAITISGSFVANGPWTLPSSTGAFGASAPPVGRQAPAQRIAALEQELATLRRQAA